MRCSPAAVICAALLIASFKATTVAVLSPNKPLWAEIIDLDGDSIRYPMSGLQAGTAYEVRVSWPATIPSVILLQLEVADSANEHRRHVRKLLDTEKVTFRADDAKAYSVRMQAKRRSRHRDGPEGGARQLMYNIVLEPVWLGLPQSAWPVALMCLAAVAGVALIVPWWVQHAVPWAVAFIVGASPSRRPRAKPH